MQHKFNLSTNIHEKLMKISTIDLIFATLLCLESIFSSGINDNFDPNSDYQLTQFKWIIGTLY